MFKCEHTWGPIAHKGKMQAEKWGMPRGLEWGGPHRSKRNSKDETKAKDPVGHGEANASEKQRALDGRARGVRKNHGLDEVSHGI